MSEVRIRRALLEDARQLFSWEAQFPSDRLSLRSIRRLIHSPTAAVWVADRDSALLGNLILLMRRRGLSARIYSLFVAPEARRSGIAEQLLQHAEAYARAAGRKRMVLEVRADAAPAQRLYAAAGYRTLRALNAYYDDGADGLRLEKPLS